MNVKAAALVAFASLLILIAQRRGWINLTNKERPSMGNILGTFDELFSPARHNATIELKEQKERRFEVPNTDSNKIHIELNNK